MNSSSICMYPNVQMNLFKGTISSERKEWNICMRGKFPASKVYDQVLWWDRSLSSFTPSGHKNTYKPDPCLAESFEQVCAPFISKLTALCCVWMNTPVSDWILPEAAPGRAVWAVMATPVPDVRRYFHLLRAKREDGRMWTNSCQLFHPLPPDPRCPGLEARSSC